MKKHYLAIAAAVLPLMAHAEWFAFDAITSNTNGIDEIAASQIFMEVVDHDPSDGAATITFTNAGPINSSVHAVYFFTRDGIEPTNLELTLGDASPEVVFDMPAIPKNLPAFDGYKASFLLETSADADNPAPYYGVNPNEYLTLSASYNEPPTLIDLMSSGDMLVGLHVIAVNDLGSVSLINNPSVYQSIVQIPEPGTFLLMGIGALGLTGLKRKLMI